MGIDTANSCVAAVDGGATTVPDSPGTSSQPLEGSNGLSGGAIAGIVIGIVAVLAFIVGIIFLARRRKRAAAKAPYRTELEATSDGVPIAEKHGHNVSEMYAGQGYERDQAVELDGRNKTSEVPVDGAQAEYPIGGQR